MKFKFYVTKKGNLAFFISNLTKWHFSARDASVFIDKTDPLSKDEKEAVKKFRKILLKYNFGPNYLGKVLTGYCDDYVYKKLKTWVKPKEYEEIREIFKIFTPRFNKIWELHKDSLYAKQKELSSPKLKEKEIIPVLEKFFGENSELKEIKTFILLSTKKNRYSSGGANAGDGKITLEVSEESLIPIAYSTIWHESVHAMFRNYIKEEITAYLEKNPLEKVITDIGFAGDPRTFLNEAVVYSLFIHGFGYLDKKFLGFNPKEGSLNHVTKVPRNEYIAVRYATEKMRNITEDYIDQKKQIDEKYLKALHKGLLEYTKVMPK